MILNHKLHPVYAIAIQIILNSLFLISGAISWPFQLSFNLFMIVCLVAWAKGRWSLIKIALCFLPAYLLYTCYGLYSAQFRMLPLYVLPPLVFVIQAYFIGRNRKVLSIFLIILTTFPSYYGMNVWLYYYKNNFFKESYLKELPVLQVADESGKRISFSDFKDTLIILDCYTTACAACFRSMPTFKDLALSYKSNSKIKFYTLNMMLPRDSFEKTVTIIKKYYNHNLFCLDTNWQDVLKFKPVPMYYIIRRNQVLYRGYLELTPVSYRPDLPELIDKFKE